MFYLENIFNMLKKDERLTFFGKGSIQLSEYNMVYIETLNSYIGKAVPFGTFKRNIYHYSELMTEPCVALLNVIEANAYMNARRSGVAKSNLSN